MRYNWRPTASFDSRWALEIRAPDAFTSMVDSPAPGTIESEEPVPQISRLSICAER